MIKSKDLDFINVLFDDVLAGKVAFMDTQKHKKIFNSLEKL